MSRKFKLIIPQFLHFSENILLNYVFTNVYLFSTVLKIFEWENNIATEWIFLHHEWWRDS